ncbi:MAG: hypothetical protein AAB875_05255 [Patescibacteria group bacterium]
MKYERIKQPEFRKIINWEWRRAIKVLAPLLKPYLNHKPTVLWDYNMGTRSGGLHGVCGRCFKGTTSWRLRGCKRWWKAPVITISKRHIEIDGEDGFREILRHEFLHLIESRHDDRFKMLCREIKADRWYRKGNALK